MDKNENEEGEGERRRTQVLCLPYVKGLSERIERECKVIESEKLKLAFRPNRTVRQALVRVKNRIPPEKKKGVVYGVRCSECEEIYVGEVRSQNTNKQSKDVTRGMGLQYMS